MFRAGNPTPRQRSMLAQLVNYSSALRGSAPCTEQAARRLARQRSHIQAAVTARPPLPRLSRGARRRERGCTPRRRTARRGSPLSRWLRRGLLSPHRGRGPPAESGPNGQFRFRGGCGAAAACCRHIGVEGLLQRVGPRGLTCFVTADNSLGVPLSTPGASSGRIAQARAFKEAAPKL